MDYFTNYENNVKLLEVPLNYFQYNMTPANRDYFDKQVEWVLARLPKKVIRLLDEIPLHVEDLPSRRLMQEMSIEYGVELCGCFTGVAIDEIHEWSQQLPNTITIFRKGIYAQSIDEDGKFRRTELRRQIRITVLHELAHFHGIDEDELEKLGYG